MNKKVGEAREILDAIGHEREKEGIKWTKYFMEKWDLEELKKRNALVELLDNTSKNHLDYKHLLMEVIEELLYSLDLPPMYRAKAELNSSGIKVTLVDRYLGTWERGTKISYKGKYDLQSLERIALDCEYQANQVEKKSSNGYKTKGGVYLS